MDIIAKNNILIEESTYINIYIYKKYFFYNLIKYLYFNIIYIIINMKWQKLGPYFKIILTIIIILIICISVYVACVYIDYLLITDYAEIDFINENNKNSIIWIINIIIGGIGFYIFRFINKYF